MNYPGIEFESIGTQVQAMISLPAEDGSHRSYSFVMEAGTEECSRAIADGLCMEMSVAIRAVKRGACQRGFEQGRNGKRKKPQTQFYADLDPNPTTM